MLPDKLHSAKEFLDTSKSPNFLRYILLRQIKSIPGKADKCLFYFDTKFLGVGSEIAGF